MLLHVRTKTTTVPGPDLLMDCPSCSARNTLAKAADITAREYLYGFIPITTNRWTAITCGSCNRAFRSPLPLADLAVMTPEEISVLVSVYGMAYVDFLTKFCIVISIVFSIVPLISLPCAIIGLLSTRKRRTRWRTAAWVGLGLSLIFCVLFIVAVSMGNKSR